ncbi:hypothetical protein ACWDOP_24465 [Nocardia sp. NPDC003693]
MAEEPTGSGGSLPETEREELIRLRGEVSALRAAGGGDVPASRAVARRIVAAVFLVLVAVLGLASVAARFVHGELLDTGRYVETVRPLSSDPTLQNEITDRVTAAIMDRVDVETVTAQALSALAENNARVPSVITGLAPVIDREAEGLVRDTASAIVASDEFEGLWVRANQEAHRGMVAVLDGNSPAAVGMDEDGTVTISLRPIIDRVRAALVARGFTLAERVPDIDRSFVLFEAPDLVAAQRWVRVLDRASAILPLATVLAGVCAVWAAPKGARRRFFSLTGVMLVVAMAVLAVGIGIGRAAALNATPPDVLSAPAATVVLDTLLEPLRTTLRAVFVLGAVIALAGFVTGSSRSAMAIRAGYRRAIDAVRSRRAGDPSSIAVSLWKFRVPVRIAIVAVAVSVLVFWSYPSGSVVLVTALVTVAALLVLELIARPALTPEPG